jgi:hypothetical protein
VQSIPNDERFDSRDRAGAAKGEGSYIGMAHAIRGACAGEPEEFGRNIWMQWAGTWHDSSTPEDEQGDPREDRRVWDTLDQNGENGFWSLMDYARDFGGAKGRKARWDFLGEISPEISDEQRGSLAGNYVGKIPDWVREVNASFAYIRDRPGGVLARDGGNGRVIRMLKVSEFRTLFANRFVPVATGKNKDGKITKRNMADAWLQHPARAEYRTADNYPDGRAPPDALNLWTGLAVAPRPGGWPLLRTFLLETICDADPGAFDYLLKLIQWKIQNPILNPEVGIILQGVPGSGKGTFARMLKVIFGEKRFHRYGKPTAAAGRFNVTAENRIVLFYDEAFFGHDRQAKGMIQGDITEPELEIEPKGIDAYTVKNIALRLFASNEPVPVPVDILDRRSLVLRLSEAHAKDIPYFTALSAAIDGREMAAFVHDALAVDLSAFEATRRHPYKTQARAELAAAGATPEEDYAFQLLHRGGPVASGFSWNARPFRQARPDPKNPWRTGPILVPAGAIHCDYVEFMHSRHRGVPVRNPDALETCIRQIIGKDLFHSQQVRLPGTSFGRERWRFVGSLGDCRAAYDRRTENAHEWDDSLGSASAPAAQVSPPPPTPPTSQSPSPPTRVVVHHFDERWVAYDADGNELI